eukprot:s324_g1.t1
MPLRGRGEKRWRLENLTEEELEKVHGDSALVLKMMALYDIVAESPAGYHAFLMEHPSDPEDYLSDTQEQEYPSVNESDVLDINDGDQEEGGLSEADQKVVQKMNRRWKEYRDVATEPIEVQNISMMEPLPSRKIKDILEALDRMWKIKDILEALDRMWSRYRALGIPIYRFHSD